MNLGKILAKHYAYLEGKPDGERADFSNVIFRARNLSCFDLREADFSRADLSGNDFCGSDLRGADFHGADLSAARLQYARLQDANLAGADLRGTNLFGAKLEGANLSGVLVSDSTIGYFPVCPGEGSFIGFKSASKKIVVLKIPEDAKRSSATTFQCRCDKAKVLRIENLGGTIAEEKSVQSNYDKNFVYRVGEIVSVEDFNSDRWVECGAGIHFFMSRELARLYT